VGEELAAVRTVAPGRRQMLLIAVRPFIVPLEVFDASS
jgi:hypothetical protein